MKSLDYNTRELIKFFKDINNSNPVFEMEGSLDTNRYGMTILQVILLPTYITLIFQKIYCYLIAQIYNFLYKLIKRR